MPSTCMHLCIDNTLCTEHAMYVSRIVSVRQRWGGHGLVQQAEGGSSGGMRVLARRWHNVMGILIGWSG
jgi:hypothetical protein